MPPVLVEFWRKKQHDITAIASIVLFFLAFFSWTLFTRKHVIEGDSLFYTYPLRTIAWRMIRAGEIPLWTPHVFSGYPLLSMAQLGLSYPLTWGYLVLPEYIAEKAVILAPFLLAPIFTYLYLRVIRRSVLGSLLGALTFGYGGLMASPLANNGLLTNSVIWLPLLLIVLEGSRRGRFIPCLIGATGIYSLSVLTGLAQGFIVIGLVAGAYAIWLSIFVPVSSSQGSRRLRLLDKWRPVAVVVGAALLSIGVAAFQILESANVVPLSVRSSLTYESFTQGSYDLSYLWRSFLTPLFYVIDTNAYVPPLAVGLSCLALFAHVRADPLKRDSRVFFWSIVAILALALMLGSNTRLYLVLYYIPVLNLFRVPSRHTIEWTFAVGVLCAYGWDYLVPLIGRWREKSRRSNLTTIYVSVALLLIAILVGYQWWVQGQTLNKDTPGWAQAATIYQFWKALLALLLLGALWRAALISSERWRGLLLGGVIVTTCFVEPSLLVHRWWSYFANPTSRLTQPSKVSQFLKQFPAADNRVYTRTALMSEQEINPRFDSPNLSGMWGLHEVAGYEPLILQRYSRALGGAWLDGVLPRDGGPPDATLLDERSHVLDLLNTTFMISYGNLATSLDESSKSTLKPSQNWNAVFENRGAIVWRNGRALPRAWLVATAETVDAETALRRIRGETAETFDPRQTALLEVPPAELPDLPGGTLQANSAAKITSYEANRLTIETDASTNTVLVLSEIYFPGWEVTVDGKTDRILRTNYLLRGVSLKAGQHKVEMRYRAPAARTGAIISVLSLGLLAALAIYSRRFWFSVAETGSGNIALTPSRSSPEIIFSRLRERIQLLPVWLCEILIFTAFLFLTALMTWPWVLHLRDAVSDPGDPYALAWTLWWDYHQTFHNPLNLFQANIFYPFRYTLAFSEHDYGIAVLFFPLFAAGLKPLTVHSIATFVGFAFCGYGAFRLTRTMTGSTAAGWIAGIIFGFVPFRLQLMSHLHYLFAGWLPLTLEALVLFVRVRSWKRAAWLGFAFLMNGLTCITWMIYALMPLALSAAVLIARHRLHRDRAFWQRGVVGLAGAALLLIPFLWPYYKVEKLYHFTWPPSEAIRYSASVSDWFSSTPRNQLWSEFGRGLPDISNHLFPGLLALLLAIAAVLLPARNDESSNEVMTDQQSRSTNNLTATRWVRVLDILILLSFVIAVLGIGYHKLGPGFFRGGTADRALTILMLLVVARLSISYPPFLRRGPNRSLLESLRSQTRSDAYWIGMVWTIVGFLSAAGASFFLNRVLSEFLLPYRSLRIPSRAAMICYVGLALLAGIGATRLAAYFAARPKPIKAWVTLTVVIVALVYELNAVPLAIVHGAVDPDALTLVLKETPMRGGVLELPTDGPDYPIHYAMLRSADHGKPLVAAASTFISPYSRRIDEFTAGPTINTSEFLSFLEQIPVSYVAVRHRMILSERKEVYARFLTEARNSGRLRLAGRYDNGDELYVVTKTEPEGSR